MNTPTKLDRRPPQAAPKIVGVPERVALFVGSIHKDRAAELLQGFSAGPRSRAEQFHARLAQWESGQRQARLAHEFGLRKDAEARLEALVLETEGALRSAVVASLPPTQRLKFPQFTTPLETLAPAMRALAARLVRETSRESIR